MSYSREITSPQSVSMQMQQILYGDEMDINQIPGTFAQYKALVSSHMEKKYQALIKIYQNLTQEPEFQTLLNTAPSSADKVKRFETTYEKAGRMLESFGVAVELLGSALLPEASLKMKYRAMVASKNNKGLRDKLESAEAKIERNVQVLYNQAKDIAQRYNIPVEIIDQYFANEDYVSMDKLIIKAQKCKHGLRYNPVTGQIKCIRKREVARAAKNNPTQGDTMLREKARKPSCYQRRKDDCMNTDHCTWEVGKRCKSNAKIEKDRAFVTHANPLYNTLSPQNFKPQKFGAVVDNPLYNRRSPLA